MHLNAARVPQQLNALFYTASTHGGGSNDLLAGADGTRPIMYLLAASGFTQLPISFASSELISIARSTAGAGNGEPPASADRDHAQGEAEEAADDGGRDDRQVQHMAADHHGGAKQGRDSV